MASPVVCQSCGVRNGLLADECRSCGEPVSRDGSVARTRRHGGSIPSAAWETKPVPEIWRNTPASTPEVSEKIDAHDFLRYALLLKAMKHRFEEEDGIIWFDDALFFLRGGYDFFCYLNLSSTLTMRGRIFGGLNHAQRPKKRFQDWFLRFIDEARLRRVTGVDVFIAEEINSGSSAHRTMNLIADTIGDVPSGSALEVQFWYYLACTDESVFDIARFQHEVVGKRELRSGNIAVKNNFRLFQGPLLAYDEERYSGLRVLSNGSQKRERYEAVRYRAEAFSLFCPSTGTSPFWCLPGENDLDNFVGVLVLNLLGVGGRVPYQIMTQRLETTGCDECRRLFRQLRAPSEVWPNREI